LAVILVRTVDNHVNLLQIEDCATFSTYLNPVVLVTKPNCSSANGYPGLGISGSILNCSDALLVREWLSRMEHLRSDYPYLFSLAVRTD